VRGPKWQRGHRNCPQRFQAEGAAMNDFSPAQAALEKIVELHGKRRAPKEIHVPNFMLRLL
jgi:hypothetical protein